MIEIIIVSALASMFIIPTVALAICAIVIKMKW